MTKQKDRKFRISHGITHYLINLKTNYTEILTYSCLSTLSAVFNNADNCQSYTVSVIEE